jgi:hypothetical protein
MPLSNFKSDGLPSNLDVGEIIENTENVQEPQNHDNDHNGIQNGLDGSRHGDESVDKP